VTLMLAEGACAGGAAIHRFGCVISHIFMVVLLTVSAMGNRCASLGQENDCQWGVVNE
jgi:hypothetical protein